jgi:hypothetical protein
MRRVDSYVTDNRAYSNVMSQIMWASSAGHPQPPRALVSVIIHEYLCIAFLQ